MTKNGVILSKLTIIEEYLIKLDQYIPISLEKLKEDWGLQKIIERSLQVMVEVMIDIAERIIASNDLLPPVTSAEGIQKLQELKVIKNAEQYIKMVRFRNLIVHNYESIDIEILHSIVNNNLGDFKMFADEIKTHEKI